MSYIGYHSEVGRSQESVKLLFLDYVETLEGQNTHCQRYKSLCIEELKQIENVKRKKPHKCEGET